VRDEPFPSLQDAYHVDTQPGAAVKQRGGGFAAQVAGNVEVNSSATVISLRWVSCMNRLVTHLTQPIPQARWLIVLTIFGLAGFTQQSRGIWRPWFARAPAAQFTAAIWAGPYVKTTRAVRYRCILCAWVCCCSRAIWRTPELTVEASATSSHPASLGLVEQRPLPLQTRK